MPPKSRRIAVILPIEMEFSSRLLEGAVEYARSHRRVRLMEIPYRVDAPNSLRFDAAPPFDAAVVWATTEARWVKSLLVRSIPVIATSRDWQAEQVPCIHFDGAAVVEASIEHLAQRSPAVLAHLEFLINGLPLAEERSRQFLDLARRRGFAAESHQIFHLGDAEDAAVTRRSPLQGRAAQRLVAFLRRLPQPAGIWCGEDTLGLRVCEVAESLGLGVPDDIAVLGLGDFRGAASGHPPLSTIPLPAEMIAYHAMGALESCLAGEAALPADLAITPPPVISRESTVGLPDRSPVGKALQLIAARACGGITAREVAAAVEVSPQTLHTFFLKRIGRTPGEEIRRVRVAAAKRLLNDSRLSIGEVAEQCGFVQPGKFTSFFRRETGTSPRDFRQGLA
jgi:DNA-binding LacI/PurR family transcriptional regulator